ncbi:hypothetical protein DICSQDRAFT_138400 [Dichomitus squalens LYAD-421 SS1]|uniref:Uncharacterized protein n=2 Tax=Dichomitus squalens TaxID=114155 RepID=R7SXI4_DICSQ|nr:uncharacterized protein DICSQDRAFT_138400 [Dichomitus squalens LYAD-421 SS1]EJF59672.1 hypothetical protein DICSQDRAFT_138400 [Dichomitus squalens LYAD-421 SS1]
MIDANPRTGSASFRASQNRTRCWETADLANITYPWTGPIFAVSLRKPGRRSADSGSATSRQSVYVR